VRFNTIGIDRMDEVRDELMHFLHIANGNYLNIRKKNGISFVHARCNYQFYLATARGECTFTFYDRNALSAVDDCL